jgi:phenylpropionate dioxygenase-like ring-hydroxylating dioxygenase large terminal subunit
MQLAGDELHKQAEFLTQCWYVAAWGHELTSGALLARTILERPVLLYRGDSGQVVALDDRCCHRGAKLSKGRLEGDCVRCMYHGLKFDASGACVQIPGQDVIPKGMGVRRYPLVERDSLVWIWMGDPALADPALILDFPYLRDPAWRGAPGYIHYDANYLLIVDNLSDFSHLAFVHLKTLGGSEEYAFKTKPISMERQATGFRVKRWHMNADPPPFHRKVVGNDDKVDRWNVGNMFVPGVFFMDSGFAPAGTGAENGNLEGAKQYRNCQFFTPETRRSTHFFWDYLHNYDLHDAMIAQSLHASMIDGFNEDKAIIEAQQQTIDADPAFRMHAIAADAPLAHFRRLLAEKISAERAGAAGISPVSLLTESLRTESAHAA